MENSSASSNRIFELEAEVKRLLAENDRLHATLISRRDLLKRLQRGSKIRARMVDSNLREGIAFQIRATRDAQGMTQTGLAEAAGMTQNNLSRIENPDYGKYTTSSLKRIAEALDVALVVRLVPFSQYIDWLSGTPRIDRGLSPASLAVPSFDKDAGLKEAEGKLVPFEKDYGMPESDELKKALAPGEKYQPSSEMVGGSDASKIHSARKGLRVLGAGRSDRPRRPEAASE